MKLVIQRVLSANVEIAGEIHSSIKGGLMLLLGIHEEDTTEDLDWLLRKVVALRIFSDDEGRMNKSVQDVKGEVLVVSQFTLYSSTAKGNRPSFVKAAKPEKAVPLYETFLEKLKEENSHRVKSGVFGADMKISLVNDGPVTIIMDSRSKD